MPKTHRMPLNDSPVSSSVLSMVLIWSKLKEHIHHICYPTEGEKKIHENKFS